MGDPAFAEQLYHWTRGSRRAFSIDEDLQLLLENTAIDSMTWADVPWPFESFVVLPARPLVSPDGAPVDCFLVSRGSHYRDRTPYRCLSLFSQRFGSFERMPNDLLHATDMAIREGRWEELGDHLDAGGQILRDREELRTYTMRLYEINETAAVSSVRYGGVVTSSGESERETNSIGEIDQDPFQLVASRIIVGLCMYLQTLPAGDGHISEWKSPNRPGEPDPDAITRESEVCLVKSVHTLTPEERRVFGGCGETGRALRAHFRRGHWRRPPGSGSDPLAARTIHVRPTLVRRDRLPEAALPSGANSLVQ